MKIAVIGSRNITVNNIADYVSYEDEIVSGELLELTNVPLNTQEKTD